MRRRTNSEFRRGQQVYDESRIPEDRYGKIVSVDIPEETVYVVFDKSPSRTVEYQFDRIRDNWNASNNTWDVI